MQCTWYTPKESLKVCVKGRPSLASSLTPRPVVHVQSHHVILIFRDHVMPSVVTQAMLAAPHSGLEQPAAIYGSQLQLESIAR